MPLGELLHEIERNNMSVLQTCQRQMLVPFSRRDLADDVPVGERCLGGEEDTTARSASQLDQQLKIAQPFAYFREQGRPIHLQEVVTIHQQFQLRPPLRKALEHADAGRLLPGFLTQADFFINQWKKKVAILG